MKKQFLFYVFSLLLVLLTISSVSAIGIVVKQQALAVSPGGIACVEYGVYDSGSTEPSRVEVKVSGQLDQVFSATDSPGVVVNAKSPQEADMIKACFKGTGSGQYTGNVLLTQTPLLESPSASTVAFGVGAPLTVQVQTSPASEGTSTSGKGIIYLIVAIIALIVIIILLVKKLRAPKEE